MTDNLYIYTVRDGSASHCFVPGMLSILLALRPYLDICLLEEIDRKAWTWPAYIWFAALKTAARFHSMPILKLMMSITGMVSRKVKL